MKKIKGHISTVGPQVNTFQGKRGHCSSQILKVSYKFPNPNNVQVKTIGPLVDMLRISLRGI